ncbi:MAG: S9 family peptidase [Bacteroidaceae bacterium]|nr:S9 family peptidase [Bacteroidaceae bacterium]
MADSLDLNGKKFEVKSALSASVNTDVLKKEGKLWSGEELPGHDKENAVHLLTFKLQNRSFFKGKIKLSKAPENYKLIIDSKETAPGDITLNPGTHTATIKYLSTPGKKDSLNVSIIPADSLKANAIEVKRFDSQNAIYTVDKMMEEWRLRTVDLSPDGKYMIVKYYQNAPKQPLWRGWIKETSTGKIVSEGLYAKWMPRTNRYYITREDRVDGKQLVTIDPVTGQQDVVASHLPDGSFFFSPNEEYLIFTIKADGPKEKNKDVYETVHPDDRQPGWRNRSTTALYDLKTGVLRPITFGYNSIHAVEVSGDGKHIFLQKSEAHLQARPTTVTSLYRLNVDTWEVDTLITRDGFISDCTVSPDGESLLIQGTPEAFNGIGKNVKSGQTPSAYDYQLFMMDIASRKVTPLTKNFNPSIANKTIWSRLDNHIYFTANHRDSVCLYRLNPANSQIVRINVPEDVVQNFDIASNAPLMMIIAQSATNSDRMYSLDLKSVSKKGYAPKLVSDHSAKILEGIQIADCKPWTFKNSVGDDITCRYYTPVNKVEGKKYPMIVYYYGGCSPVERNFESSYPWQCWAALGYYVLVVQPSGAAGFGQEFSARHVNTAGVDPARDIIEATKTFCEQHNDVNAKKIGCCGASYGGFMTQYLQTVTDIFACAISHAGISDHTTYWGLGYWGYTYSEVSMANSYPWSHTDLYVKNSPIYNVDKIHTPILFLHGNKDVNVPYNNSVQMFTALKLLGRDVAFVTVDGEDHGIVEYNKRLAWLNTQLAWFARYLQDDDTWWYELYPQKTLY